MQLGLQANKLNVWCDMEAIRVFVNTGWLANKKVLITTKL